MLREALQLRQQVLGPQDELTLWTMKDLAEQLMGMGQMPEAERLFQQAIHGLDPGIAVSLIFRQELAVCIGQQGRHKEAAAQHQKLQQLMLEHRDMGPKHLHTLLSGIHRAVNLRKLGRHEEALQLYSDVLKVSLRVLPPEHGVTHVSMHEVAAGLASLGQHFEAAVKFEEVLDIRRRVLGPTADQTLASLRQLADTREALGQHSEAAALRQQLPTS